jgi:hypothetical protein
MDSLENNHDFSSKGFFFSIEDCCFTPTEKIFFNGENHVSETEFIFSTKIIELLDNTCNANKTYLQ